MAASVLDNIIPLSSAQARRRHVKPESVGVINDCRDIAVKRITEVLAKTFDKIEDELFDLAEKSIDREAQNMYLDARNQAREKRSVIESAFRKQFLSFFERKVDNEEATPVQAKTDFSALEMSLVDDSDLEEKLAVSDISKRLTDKCDEELRALSQRMGFLLSVPDLQDDANPIAPDTIVRALKIACDHITSGHQTRITVMRMMEQHMAQEMLTVYRDINSHLVSRQILPQIRPSYRKTQTHITRKPAADQNSLTHTDLGGTSGAYTAPQSDLFATLQQLMHGTVAADRRSYDGSMPSLANAAAATAPGREAPIGPAAHADLLAALTQIQKGAWTEAPQFSATAAAKHFVPGVTPPTSLNVLHEIRADGIAGSRNAMDAMTIDIVAMLFDYVFDDKEVPDTIKALIARLQIPVLKVAILDKSFFSKKAHPARRLLDSLVNASLCLPARAGRDDPLFQKIESTIDAVHAEFESDISVFSNAIETFEKFLSERESANQEVVEQTARALHEREKREMARLIAADETERLVKHADLPAPVTAMVRGPWARVLERVYLKDGGRTARFNDALTTANNLVWSVTPKLTVEDRRSLVSMLPVLLKNLEAGLDIAAVEREDATRFFASLVDCHAAAVRAGLRGESVATLFEASQHSREVKPLFEKLIAEEQARDAAMQKADRAGVARIQFTSNGVEVEEISPERAGAPSEAPQSLSDATPPQKKESGVPQPTLKDIKRGTLVEFKTTMGKSIRAKLSWISPLKGVYLFTNAGANEAISISPSVLQSQLESGEAVIIAESSAIDRAVGRMVQSLSKTQHA
jgi:hypothetical protein